MSEVAPSVHQQVIELQMRFYRDIVVRNPLVDPILFLFIEQYPEVAIAIRDAQMNNRKLTLDIHIQQDELEKFFSDLGHVGIYECGLNFVYYLHERLKEAQKNTSSEDWKVIMENIYNNPLVIAQAKKRLRLIVAEKEKELVGILDKR